MSPAQPTTSQQVNQLEEDQGVRDTYFFQEANLSLAQRMKLLGEQLKQLLNKPEAQTHSNSPESK